VEVDVRRSHEVAPRLPGRLDRRRLAAIHIKVRESRTRIIMGHEIL
jgi:hypothetical protein